MTTDRRTGEAYQHPETVYVVVSKQGGAVLYATWSHSMAHAKRKEMQPTRGKLEVLKYDRKAGR